MSTYPNFVGGAYKLKANNAAADRCVNLYPSTIQSGTGKGKKSLELTPGLTAFGTLPKTQCRGLWAGDNRLFAVGGDSVYEVSNAGVSTLLGAMNVAFTPVTIVANGVGTQLMFVSGNQVWVSNGGAPVRPSYGTLGGLVDTSAYDVLWRAGDKFTPTMVDTTITITGVNYTVFQFINEEHITLTTSAGLQTLAIDSWVDYVLGVAGAYIGGYFVILKPDSNTINVSALNNGLSWDALDFQQRISRPDRLKTIYTVGSLLWVFGTTTSEAWYLTANDFPLAPVENSTIDYGIHAAFSVAAVGENSIMWLSRSDRGIGPVKLANGLKASNVSTYAVDLAIASYANSDEAIAFSYSENGHTFYVINFPIAQKTWAYDIGENEWHERAYSTDMIAQLQGFHAAVFGKHIVGSVLTANLYEQSQAYYNDAGTTIRRQRTAPVLSEEELWQFFDYFTLDASQGQNVSAAPEVTLEISNDGGNTFFTVSTMTMAAAADYTKRAKWNRLGRSRNRVFRVTSDSAQFQSWVNAYLGVRAGTGV